MRAQVVSKIVTRDIGILLTIFVPERHRVFSECDLIRKPLKRPVLNVPLTERRNDDWVIEVYQDRECVSVVLRAPSSLPRFLYSTPNPLEAGFFPFPFLPKDRRSGHPTRRVSQKPLLWELPCRCHLSRFPLSGTS